MAADAELLEGLTELLIQPVDVTDADQTFSQRARISSLTDFKNISTEQVYVTVNIEEVQQSAWVAVDLTFINTPEGLNYTYTSEDFRARVTGPASQVEALAESGVQAVVDLAGLTAGHYTLPITVDETIYPNLQFEFEPASVSLRLDDVSGVD